MSNTEESESSKSTSTVVYEKQPTPMTRTDTPEGLEPLRSVERLFVQQKTKASEVLCGWESNNEYHVKNDKGQTLYSIMEDTSCCIRWCFGKDRNFTYHVTDSRNGKTAMIIKRPFKLCVTIPCMMTTTCCCPYPIYVTDSDSKEIGMVRPTCSFCTPQFGVYSHTGLKLYSISGRCCQCHCCCCRKNINFMVYKESDGRRVGNIAKRFGGILKEIFTDADTFCVDFPTDASVPHKALLLAAAIMVDMHAFEGNSLSKKE